MYCSPAVGKPVADVLALHPNPSSAASPINSFHLQNHKPPSPQLARAPKCHPVLTALQVFAVCSHCSFKPGAEDVLSFHGVRLLSNQRPPGSSPGCRLARETVQARLHIGLTSAAAPGRRGHRVVGLHTLPYLGPENTCALAGCGAQGSPGKRGQDALLSFDSGVSELPATSRQ